MLQGEAVCANVSSVQKANSGSTGSLICDFSNAKIGELVENVPCGVFGKYDKIGNTISEQNFSVAEIVRFAPSACNTQPWYVENQGGKLTVSRYKKPGKRGIMPAAAVSYFNRIDIGIYLCILEICMQKKEIEFSRELFIDNGSDAEFTKVAEYTYKANPHDLISP